MKCKSCRTANPPDAKFCRQCGTQLQAPSQAEPTSTGRAAAKPAPSQSYATQVFTWIGYVVVGLFVLAFLANF